MVTASGAEPEPGSPPSTRARRPLDCGADAERYDQRMNEARCLRIALRLMAADREGQDANDAQTRGVVHGGRRKLPRTMTLAKPITKGVDKSMPPSSTTSVPADQEATPSSEASTSIERNGEFTAVAVD